MTGPRIFVSSTYYDLKHVRSSLDAFLSSLGFEAILSEKGEIAYAPDAPLDESCYRAAKQADVFVLIIGGRYGSAASSESSEISDGFLERYDSITKKEYEAAISENVPCYILIERAVYAEYQTFRKNREKPDILYAHVDSVNVFKLMDEILARPRNNPVFQFDRYHEIEEWLRNQWAGLFKDLLNRLSEREQLITLGSQIAQLAESNKTMRRYLEEVMSSVSPDKSQVVIDQESKRLDESRKLDRLSRNDLSKFILSNSEISSQSLRDLITKSNTVLEFFELIVGQLSLEDAQMIRGLIDEKSDAFLDDVNDARNILELPRWLGIQPVGRHQAADGKSSHYIFIDRKLLL